MHFMGTAILELLSLEVIMSFRFQTQMHFQIQLHSEVEGRVAHYMFQMI